MPFFIVLGWKHHLVSMCNNGEIDTAKAIIDLLKDFTPSLVPCGHTWIGLANKPVVILFIVAHTTKPFSFFFFFFYHRIVNKAVNISMRFKSNLSVFNFVAFYACHALLWVHEMRFNVPGSITPCQGGLSAATQ